MSKFITNIQLQNPDEIDYKKLQTELEGKSFKSESFAAKSKAYLLGREVFYSIEGNFSLKDVINSVSKSLANLSVPASFFVMRDKNIPTIHH
jgi:hypothetical protein